MKTKSINSFSELIKKQEGLLMRLSAVVLQQLNLVHASDMTALLHLLGQKYQLLNEYDVIRKALLSYGEFDTNNIQWKNENERIETQNSIEHCKQLLDEIISNDKQSIEDVKLKIDDLKDEINRFSRVTHTQLGYVKAAGKQKFVKHFDVKEK
ncbi:MAG: hypothetical protein LBE18_04300 [Planctomycetaceae bacterium]|jgi:hypothetical protein|nr:hypothetical protein [Planctomycetaceae bacterium]